MEKIKTETKKIKVSSVDIVVDGNVDKPYYSIKYYDMEENKWHCGYGSYYLANVKRWLKENFDIIKPFGNNYCS